MTARPSPPSRQNSHTSSSTRQQQPRASTSALSTYLEQSFIPSITPTEQEYEIKEHARLLLQGFVERLWPGARLMAFGSMANGFALKGSDMDLCCFLPNQMANIPPAGELVETLGRLLQEETSYQIKPLPRARIPIIKLILLPDSISCDIGFENRLALENTRLLNTYRMIDKKLEVLVLFLKIWTKKRQINNPYRGTLSSYGYVLLVIHFLTNVKFPSVLPNLQRLPLLAPLPLSALHYSGCDIYFFDSLESLSKVWNPDLLNTDNVGELLVELFAYYAGGFDYGGSVVSIRSEGGIVSKEEKGWGSEHFEYEPEVIVRDLHKLCIEDPFQLNYNVARTVTKDGLYTIRGEFMRGHRILTSRTGSIPSLIADLCEERDDSLVLHPPSDRNLPSPRRRSAPSARMNPQPPPPPPPATGSMESFRLWAALNVRGVGTPEQNAFTRGIGSGLEEGWDGSSVGNYNGGSTHFYQTGTGLNQNQFGGNRRNGNLGAGGGGHYSHQHQSTSASSPTPSLERRVSWDGSATTTATNGGGGYDLHRFFQNQPGDVPIPNNSGGGRATLTAPSSPDMRNYSSSGLSFGSSSGYQQQQQTRSGYRYNGRNVTMGPRMAASSVPRNHHYTTTIPTSSTITSTTIALEDYPITFGTFPCYNIPSTSTSTSGSSDYGTAIGDDSLPFSIDQLSLDERGRELRDVDADGEGDKVNRPRGRSVPHVRLDSEGRQAILFGEIKAVLPPPPLPPTSTNSSSPPPSIGIDSIPNGSIPSSTSSISLPLLTTSPPTPVKSSVVTTSSRSSPTLSPPLQPFVVTTNYNVAAGNERNRNGVVRAKSSNGEP